jgi:hypothetical protein
MELKIYQMKIFKNKKNTKYTGVVEGYPIPEEKRVFFDLVEDYEDYKGNKHENGKGVIYFGEDFNHEGMITSDITIEVEEVEDKQVKKIKSYNLIEEEWTSIFLKTGNPTENNTKGTVYKVPVFIETDKEEFDNAPNKEAFDEGLKSLGLIRISEQQENNYHNGNVVYQSWPLTFEKFVPNISRDNAPKNYKVIVKTVKNSDGEVTFRSIDKIFDPIFKDGDIEITGNIESIEENENDTKIELKEIISRENMKLKENKNKSDFGFKTIVNQNDIEIYYNVKVQDCEAEKGDEVTFNINDENVQKKKTAIIKLKELKVYNPFN